MRCTRHSKPSTGNRVEPSAHRFWAEGSDKRSSTQYLRPNIEPIYQKRMSLRRCCKRFPETVRALHKSFHTAYLRCATRRVVRRKTFPETAQCLLEPAQRVSNNSGKVPKRAFTLVTQAASPGQTKRFKSEINLFSFSRSEL